MRQSSDSQNQLLDTDIETGSIAETIRPRPGSTGTLAISDMFRNNTIMENKKAALGTFSLVCGVAIIIGVGYIYINHTFVTETVNRHDIDVSDDDFGDNTQPRADPHRAIFILPDVDNSQLARYNLTTVETIFDRNISGRPIVGSPNSKHPVSLLQEVIRHPTPAYNFTECPISQPRKFFRANLTIGEGLGVLGYGTSKKLAKKMAAEDALHRLYNVTFPGEPVDCEVLANRCGL